MTTEIRYRDHIIRKDEDGRWVITTMQKVGGALGEHPMFATARLARLHIDRIADGKAFSAHR